MISESAYMIYEKWRDSAEYKGQSCIENKSRAEHDKTIRVIAGEQVSDELEDCISDLCSEVEQAAFAAGMKYGIHFFQEIMRGAVQYEKA